MIDTGKAILSNVFGNGSAINVLDFLLTGEEFDFTLSQIARGTGLSRTAVRNAIAGFIERKLVVVTRQDPGPYEKKHFRLNQEHKIVPPLRELQREIEDLIIRQ